MKDIIVGRSDEEREKFGREAMVQLGKQYIQMGQTTSLSNNVYLDFNSSHVVFICGKRGGGKCLPASAKITLHDGSRTSIKDLQKSDKALHSLHDDCTIDQADHTEFYERTVQQTLKLTLKTGRTLELTPNHPLLTIDGWEPAENLEEGSRIATARELDAFGEQPLPEEHVKLLAYLIAEGHLDNKKVLFTNTDEQLRDEFKRSVTAFDNDLRLVKEENHTVAVRATEPVSREITERDEQGRIQSSEKRSGGNSLKAFLETIGLYGQHAHEKTIPQRIFTAPKHQVATFLNRLFSCDGSIYRHGNNWRISYTSTSEDLVNNVQHLLIRFGIISTKRTKETAHRDAYQLTIQGSFAYTYLQEIGFYGDKENRQQRALRELPRHDANPNTDTIPKGIWEQYEPNNWADAGRSLDYEHPKALSQSKQYSPSRQKLKQIAEVDGAEHIQQLAQSDIYWDEITDIETIDEEQHVYDITVPETHNFIADDVIVHNSYTMGVMAEGVADLDEEIRQNLSIILVDTMGVYWTMKYANDAQEDLLDEWGLEPKAMDPLIFTPEGYYHKYKEEGIPTDKPFSINPAELSGQDWVESFGLDENDDTGVLIERVVHDLHEAMDVFGINDILSAIDDVEDVEQTTKNAAKNRFLNAEDWGLFNKDATAIKDLAVPGKVSVLDVSCYATMSGSWKVKNLVMKLVADKLFTQRMRQRKEEEFKDVQASENPFTEDREQEQDFPLVWLIIDEAHEFLPHEDDGKTLATDPLVTILREGRQPGISLTVASQQPGKIHTDVMTQCDTVLSHRITAKKDTKALGKLMQSYMRHGLTDELDNLPREKGAAVIFDDTNEKLHQIRVRPRFTWHGGSAPNAIHDV
jgi:intein/homing endonuclease